MKPFWLIVYSLIELWAFFTAAAIGIWCTSSFGVPLIGPEHCHWWIDKLNQVTDAESRMRQAVERTDGYTGMPDHADIIRYFDEVKQLQREMAGDWFPPPWLKKVDRP